MIGGWDKQGRIYCCLCGKKTTEEDINHEGAIVKMQAMRYPFCGKCVRRKDSQIISAIKARRK